MNFRNGILISRPCRQGDELAREMSRRLHGARYQAVNRRKRALRRTDAAVGLLRFTAVYGSIAVRLGRLMNQTAASTAVRCLHTGVITQLGNRAHRGATYQ